MKTYYICDRRLPCNTSDLCGKCKHTSNKDHALYPDHFDFNHSGRDLVEVERKDYKRFA